MNPDNPNHTSVDGVLYSKDLSKILLVPAQTENITIPKSVTHIEEEAFQDCRKLTSISLKSNIPELIQMIQGKETRIVMETSIKYLFASQLLFNSTHPAASAFVKKNFVKFAHMAIDRGRVDELKQYVSLGFITKANIGKYILYALENKKDKETILYLLSVKDAKGGFKLEEIDKYIELALENVELTAALLEYKNKYFTPEHIDAVESDKIEKELGFKERTAAEWKKIFGYEVKDGEVTITAYKGSDVDIIIPETICKKPVTAIADMAFSPEKPRTLTAVKEKLNSIRSVYIGENIKKLGSSVFKSCEGLENVTITASITTIPEDTFMSCHSLKSVSVSSSLTTIGKYSFADCSSLTSITLPDSITTISECSFSGCKSLKSISLPENVTDIGHTVFEKCSNLAFYKCFSLADVSLPEGLIEIDGNAFYECRSLSSITIPDGVTKIGSGAFKGCSSLTSIKIPNGVNRIGDTGWRSGSVFYGCVSLTSVSIPDSVEEIISDSFNGCTALENIEVSQGNSVYTTIDGSVYSKDKTKLIMCARGCKSIVIPDGVTEISFRAFYGCSSITSVSIPNSVNKIGEEAFAGCTSLASITIPDGVTEIDTGAFEYCKSLKSISIPNSVKEISYSAFKNCHSLTSITIPESITKIDREAFYCCLSLANITIPNSVTKIGCEAFYSCQSLTSIILPNSIKVISEGLFGNCMSLTSIEIPYGVTEIKGGWNKLYSAFLDCTSLVQW